MRSSKSRSRGKNNRNRSPSNNINRVFDSSGPEGKVRGTPQQIIDKYTQLSRDAFLGNDRVAGENFQQHAEHYARLLNEAQKDAETKRQQNQPQQGGNNGNANGQNDNQSNGGNNNGNANDGNGNNQRKNRDAQRREEKQNRDRSNDGGDPGSSPQPDVIDTADDDIGLVETPENAQKDEEPKAEKPKKPRAPRKPRAKKTDEDKPADLVDAAEGKADGSAPEAAE